MDPQQTWVDMLTALQEKRWDDANELADALYAWIHNGGFPPVTVGHRSLGRDWHKTIATSTCLAIVQRVGDIRKRRSRQGSAKGGD